MTVNSIFSKFLYKVQHVGRGAGDVSMAKSTHCLCRGPKFGPQHSQQVIFNYL